MFQVYSVPRPLDDLVGFAPLEIDRGQVLADGAAVIEPQPGVDRQPIRSTVMASLAKTPRP